MEVCIYMSNLVNGDLRYHVYPQLAQITIYLHVPVSLHIDRLVQERHNSSALAMEMRFSCTNPSI